MKILIELPSWLGDTVMATPAIENIIKHYGEVELTLIGSLISIEALKCHPRVIKTFVIEKKISSFFRIFNSLEKFDLFISFRSTLRAKFHKLCISSKKKYQFNKKRYENHHQVEKYNSFINEILNIDSIPGKLVIYRNAKTNLQSSKIMGINPGASYGNAKRWSPKEFANIAIKLAHKYDIIIFGGHKEKKIADDIEKYLNINNIHNYKNLVGKTSISSLIDEITNLDLFITGDSGPMHIASAFQIPTVSIFGPTNDRETSQWMNKKNKIVKMNLDCQPCMKRVCPLKHHNCMRLIKSEDVLHAIEIIK
jgi:heptosyltransferase-2